MQIEKGATTLSFISLCNLFLFEMVRYHPPQNGPNILESKNEPQIGNGSMKAKPIHSQADFFFF